MYDESWNKSLDLKRTVTTWHNFINITVQKFKLVYTVCKFLLYLNRGKNVRICKIIIAKRSS